MPRISLHPFEVPASGEFPPLFSGFVCVGYAAGRWWSGIDTDSSQDAYHHMIDTARLSLIPAAKVEKDLDPAFYPSTIQVFRVEAE